ncbi:DUF1127 domain-containing protein [Yoonia sp. R2331]|uniref:DUF1127 domain-containing protein n=1 Tax=Yoonia sp. R2331 TaxID=3237238 RepID=UPI0034E39179
MYTASSFTAINTPVIAAKPAPVSGLIGKLIALHKQRKALARMDDAQLHDLGLTFAEAQAEASRPLWDVPATWAQ